MKRRSAIRCAVRVGDRRVRGQAITGDAEHGFAPRFDQPPPERARLMLPASFGTRFAIFADAEEEFDWHAPFSRDCTSVKAIAALPKANRFFTERGCTPTYLVDWPVADTPSSADLLRQMREDGQCDIGTQLHPWVNPPFDEPLNPKNSYVGNLTVAVQRAKLARLTERIEVTMGSRPLIHRAGRYGVGAQTASLLLEQGYKLDVSVRPHFDYRAQHGPDFSARPIWPWHLAPSLAELPLTTACTGMLRDRQGLPQGKVVRGVMARLGLFNRVPLTPEGVRLPDALSAIGQLLDKGHQLFSLSFHTPSVVPGHTPYVRDAADLKAFWAWWDGVFEVFSKKGVTPVGSTEILHAFETAGV